MKCIEWGAFWLLGKCAILPFEIPLLIFFNLNGWWTKQFHLWVIYSFLFAITFHSRSALENLLINGYHVPMNRCYQSEDLLIISSLRLIKWLHRFTPCFQLTCPRLSKLVPKTLVFSILTIGLGWFETGPNFMSNMLLIQFISVSIIFLIDVKSLDFELSSIFTLLIFLNSLCWTISDIFRHSLCI